MFCLFSIPLNAFGQEYFRQTGENVPIDGYHNVLDMLASLFMENPLEGLRLRLASSDDDGIVIVVEIAQSDEERTNEKCGDKDARKDL